jgi:hypothetical protein
MCRTMYLVTSIVILRVSNSRVQVYKKFDNTCKLLLRVVNSLFVGEGCILYCKVCVKICNI